MVGRFERNKDTVQEITESAATHVGNIAGIITSAVKDITHEIGEGFSEAVEMYEASQRAKADSGETGEDEQADQHLPDGHAPEPPPVIDPDGPAKR